MKSPEIEELKRLVKEKYEDTLATSTDFEVFSLMLKNKYNANVSTSTLKRLYDYVGDEHKPRISTLNALSRYIGHSDFSGFVAWLKTSPCYNSSFFNADQLMSSDLRCGDEVEIGFDDRHGASPAGSCGLAARLCGSTAQDGSGINRNLGARGPRGAGTSGLAAGFR